MKWRGPFFLFLNLLFLDLCMLNLVGCAGFGQQLKNFLGGRSGPEAEEKIKPNYTRFSENPNVTTPIRRQYRRTTKKSLSEEAQLDSRAGSLWIMEGQGSYLFSQNIIRMIGDPMPVKVDGEPRDQLQSKVNVIRKLLAKLEQRMAPSPAVRAPANSTPGTPTPEAAGAKAGEKAAEKEDPATNKSDGVMVGNDSFAVQTVPTRIVERLIDGNYRVRGSQPFMIGPREYKVIVTGIVRAEDFSDEGISSSKLLDPKYDIVSVKRKDE